MKKIIFYIACSISLLLTSSAYAWKMCVMDFSHIDNWGVPAMTAGWDTFIGPGLDQYGESACTEDSNTSADITVLDLNNNDCSQYIINYNDGMIGPKPKQHPWIEVYNAESARLFYYSNGVLVSEPHTPSNHIDCDQGKSRGKLA